MINNISIRLSIPLIVLFLTIPFIVIIYLNTSIIIDSNSNLKHNHEKLHEIDIVIDSMQSKITHIQTLVTNSVLIDNEYTIISSMQLSEEFEKELRALSLKVSKYNNEELQNGIKKLEVRYDDYILYIVGISLDLIEDVDNRVENLLKLNNKTRDFNIDLEKLCDTIDNIENKYIDMHTDNVERMVDVTIYSVISIVILNIIIALLLRMKLLCRMNDLLEYIESIKHDKNKHDNFILKGNDELSQISKSFNNLLNVLSENNNKIRYQDSLLQEQAKLAQMGEMLNMVAHQWRQPLGSISASAISMTIDCELGMPTRESVQKHSKDIQDTSTKMSQVINDFMIFNKPEANGVFFIYDAVIDVIDICELQLESKLIDVKIEVDEDLEIFHNIKSIEHILLNLIMNSRDAFEDKEIDNKKIKIKTTFDDRFIYMRVEDNAGGIPDDIINKIFNPYFTTKEQGKGTGIGLYMSKQMTEQIVGTSLSVEVIKDRTIFTIKFTKET